MGTISERLMNILNSFDEMDAPFDESDVYKQLNSLASEKLVGEEQENFSLQAETMAFGFIEDYQNKKTGWDTYFGPLAVLTDDKGQWYETPSIRLVTPEMLSYWFERANSAKNPVLKRRYADLVWDFTRQVTETAPKIPSALIIIDNSLLIVGEKRYVHEGDAIKKLIRALSIALSISDDVRTKQAIADIIAFEDQIGEDTKLGLWGFSFDALIKNKKIPLTEEQSTKIIADLECRLMKYVNNNDYAFSVHAAENAAMRLMQYYQRLNDTNNVHRVLRDYGNLVVASVEKGRALAGLALIEKLFDIYSSHGMKSDAETLAPLLEKLGIRTHEEMHTFSHTVEIPKDEIEQYFLQILDKSFENALTRIAGEFIPDPDEVEAQIRDLAKEAPITYLITHSLQDKQGRTCARIGPLDEDFDGHVVYQTSRDMTMVTPFLNEAIKRAFDKYQPSLDNILDFMYVSPIYHIESRSIISSGLEAYRSNNHLVAAHLIIPQIENTIRHLLKLSGGAVYRPGRNGGLFLKTLDEILREESIRNILGKNIAQYLQVLLTDPRGWNLRNDVCHGMAPRSMFGPALTDRLFHVLLVLSLFRINQENSESELDSAEAQD